MKLSSLIFLLIIFKYGFCQDSIILNKFSAYKFNPPEFKKGQESFDKYINTILSSSYIDSSYVADFILTTDTTIKLDKEWKANIHITQRILVSSRFWKVATLNNIPVNSKIRIIASQLNDRSYVWTGSYQWIVTPELADIYYFEGVKLSESKNYIEAIKFFDETLYLFSTDIDALYNRGICKFKIGDKAGACVDWKRISSVGKPDADGLISKYCN
jgi:tetratricopeptide (TPR) repeat protein